MADTFTFNISEDNFQGDAQFVVSVDGKPISGTLTATASHGLGQTQAFTFSGDYGSARQITVKYLNDLFAGIGHDRDLYVDSFTFDGHTQVGTAAIVNTGTVSGTSANLIRTNDTATYDVSQYTAASTSTPPASGTPAAPAVHLNAEYRLFNEKSGDHLFTTSVDELNHVLRSDPNYRYEGVVGSTPDKGAGTEDVFRFFDVKTGDHFYTTSTTERDQVLKTLPNLHYEGVAFQAYTNPSATDASLVTVERFLDTKTGLHMYTSAADEIKAITGGQYGAGWVDEGKAFTVHAAADAPLSVTADTTGAHLNEQYRLFNDKTGDHLFTTSVDELNQVLKNSPDYRYEGVIGSTPDKGAGTEDVFRFFDVKTGDHLYTASTTERDQVLKTMPNLHYEGVAFQAYANPSATDSSLETVERFFDTKTGLHMYTAAADEIKAITSGQYGAGWIDEGKAFTIHVATDGLLHA